MQKLEIFDETFDPHRTESYELSIQVNLNGFSFCIKDLTRDLFIALGSAPFNLSVASSDDWPKIINFIKDSYEWLPRPFNRVILSFESPSFTIVPKEFFIPEKAKTMLTQSHPIEELDEIRYYQGYNDMVSIFNAPSMLISSWLKVHPKTKIIGFCDAPLLYHALSVSNGKEDRITIAAAQKFSTVIVSQGQKIMHCTSIESNSVEDTVYHLLNICNSLTLSPKEISVKMMGSVNYAEKLEIIIARFFKDISLATVHEQNHFSYLLTRHKAKFGHLFNQSLCE